MKELGCGQTTSSGSGAPSKMRPRRFDDPPTNDRGDAQCDSGKETYVGVEGGLLQVTTTRKFPGKQWSETKGD